MGEDQLQPSADIEAMLRRDISELAQRTADDLMANAADNLAEERDTQRGFTKRLRQRFSESFELADLFLSASTEIGNIINTEERPAAVERNDAKFEALIRNHARSCRVAREVFTLCENGYADGAISRWRTMHEIAVVSLFLRQSAAEVSERFLHHDAIGAWQSASSHAEHAARLNCVAPTEAELEALGDLRESLSKHYGRLFKRDYGWAQTCFPNLTKRAVTLRDLEAAVQLDFWRPRYVLASQSVHPSAKGAYWNLAAGPMRNFMLVGPSDQGIPEALHGMFLSLNHVSACLVVEWGNLERLTHLEILRELESRAGEALLREAPPDTTVQREGEDSDDMPGGE